MEFAGQSGATSLERGWAFQGPLAWAGALGPGTSQLDPEDLATCLAEAVGVAFAARTHEERSRRTHPVQIHPATVQGIGTCIKWIAPSRNLLRSGTPTPFRVLPVARWRPGHLERRRTWPAAE